MLKNTHKAVLTFSFLSVVFGASAQAQRQVEYEVTITNVTKGQTFTPQLVVAHQRSASIFELGEPASDALEILAEDGDTGPLTDELANVTTGATTIGGLLGPGESVSTVVAGNPWRDRLSVAAMLIPTNDTFMSLNSVALPRRGERSYLAPAYDAGTEVNDQDCANMPGPRCGGEGFNGADGEGYVHIGNGFHTLPAGAGGEVLGPLQYDWRNPVAQITVRRLY